MFLNDSKIIFSKAIGNSFLKVLLLGSMATIVTSCAHLPNFLNQNNKRVDTVNTAWLQDGVLVLSRPAPLVTDQKADSNKMFGFLPSLEDENYSWLSINTSNNQIRLMEGSANKLSISYNAEGISDSKELKAGIYEILHKQRHPVWHANEEYFSSRKLHTPSEGDAERLLKGVLGEFALFIEKDLPIHSGPVVIPELGGIRLSEDDIARIYYHLEVGSQVVVE